MLTSALSALLPQTRDRSDANLGKRTISLRSVWGFLTFNLHSIAESNVQALGFVVV